MSSSGPQSGVASPNPSDFLNTPAPSTPNLGLGAPGIPQGQEVLSYNAANVSPVPSTPTPRNVPTPILTEKGDVLVPPGMVGSLSNVSSNPESYNPSSINDAQLLAGGRETTSYPEIEDHSLSKRRPLKLLFAALVALVIIILAIVIPVYFVIIKKHGNSNTSSTSGGGSSSGGGGGNGPGASSGLTSGGDGSIVTTETGEQFTYKNSFGGFCEYSIRLIQLTLRN